MTRSRALVAVSVLALAAAALAIRLPRLGARPMHGDEANQAVKTGILWDTGVYEYDPDQHHGPSLYWLTLPALWLSGAEDFAHSSEFMYRIVPVAFGAGLIVLLLLVADGLGRGPVIIAGILTAISPAMVFYSRYYVQEMLLVFFTLAAIGCAWRYVGGKKGTVPICRNGPRPTSGRCPASHKWGLSPFSRSGSIGWAMAAGASFGLMHATKETWVLAAAAMAAALALSLAWSRLGRKDEGLGMKDEARQSRSSTSSLIPHRSSLILHTSSFLLAACLVAIALYSSFGANWKGPLDSLVAFDTYLRRGTEDGIHSHPWYQYFEWLAAYRPAKGFFWTEGLIVGLACVGVVAALWRRDQRGSGFRVQGSGESGSGGTQLAVPTELRPDLVFPRFLAFYTLVLTALYCAIPYKTPWCLLSFLDGMILLAGVGAWAILRWLPGLPLKVLGGSLLAAGAAHLGWESYRLNFDPRLYADYRNPYVYAHTSTDVLNLAARMEQLAQVSPDGHKMMIHVVTPENCWPLPWYLRKFPRVGCWPDPAVWHRETQRSRRPSVIILTPDVRAAVDARFPSGYDRQANYLLRPGVRLYLYARDERASTSTDVLNLVAQLERLARVSPEGHAMAIHVVTPEDCRPLPSYLRKFSRVGYWADPGVWETDSKGLAPPSIVILTPDVQEAVNVRLRAAYNQQMIYGLRPGVLLHVYAREDLWQAFLASVAPPR